MDRNKKITDNSVVEAATRNYTRFVTNARQWAINEVKRILLETCMAVEFRT